MNVTDDIFETQSGEHGVFIDPLGKVILIKENETTSAMVTELVPPGINIFALLNIGRPSNVVDLDHWRIIINTNNHLYSVLRNVFETIERIHWHSEMPDYAYRLLLGLYLPIVILGATLNTFLLFTMLSTKQLRVDPRNSFILALACSDFFLCNFTSPLTLWSTLEGHWPLGSGTEILCRFVKAGQDFPIIMSSFCIGAIACDRFRYIVQPHKTQMTANQGFALSLCLAMVSAFFVSPVFVKAGLKSFQYLERTYYCEVVMSDDIRVHYTLITSAAHYFLTLVIVIVLYAAIYLRLRSRPPSQHEEVNRRRRRTNILLASITVVFFVCWGPLVVYCLLHDFARHLLPERAVMASFGYTLSLLSGMITPIANPILYSLLNESYREVLRHKFRRWCPRFCQLCLSPSKGRLHHASARSTKTNMSPDGVTVQAVITSSPKDTVSNCYVVENAVKNHKEEEEEEDVDPDVKCTSDESVTFNLLDEQAKTTVTAGCKRVTKRRARVCIGQAKLILDNHSVDKNEEDYEDTSKDQNMYDEPSLLETSF